MYCRQHTILSFSVTVVSRSSSSRVQRDVAAAASGSSQPPGASAPQGLFVKKIAALALIFPGGTINYTILQVGVLLLLDAHACCHTLLQQDAHIRHFCEHDTVFP